MPEYENQAAMFCDAIRAFANKPDNLNNLESYLSYSFAAWLKKWANTPEDIVTELKCFAEMQLD